MATITKFEDLIAWQEARKMVKMLYKLTSNGSLAQTSGCATRFSGQEFPG